MVIGPASCLAALRLVLRARITGKSQALLVGVGAVPAAFAAIVAAVCWTCEPDQPMLNVILTMCYAFEAMLCGWAGASAARLNNMTQSGQPDLVRSVEEQLARARSRPRRPTANSRLRELGLPATRTGAALYSAGWFGSAFWFVAAMCGMARLGFWDQHTLARLPLLWRSLGVLIPVSAPGLLWALTARRVRPLAGGLRDGAIPGGVLFAVWYIIANVAASV